MASLRLYWHETWEDSLCCSGKAEEWAWASGYAYKGTLASLRRLRAPGLVPVALYRHPRTFDTRLATDARSVSRAVAAGYAKVEVLGFCYPVSRCIRMELQDIVSLGCRDTDGRVTLHAQQGGQLRRVNEGATLLRAGGAVPKNAADAMEIIHSASVSGPVEMEVSERPGGTVLLRQAYRAEDRDHRCFVGPMPEGYRAEDERADKEGEALGWVLAAVPDSTLSVPLRAWRVPLPADELSALLPTLSEDLGPQTTSFSCTREWSAIPEFEPLACPAGQSRVLTASAETEQELLRDGTVERIVAAVEQHPFDGCVPLWRVRTEGDSTGWLMAGRPITRLGKSTVSADPYLRASVFGKLHSHQQYCHVTEFGMYRSDAGMQIQDSFIVHRHPLPGLTCWEVVKVEGAAGNIVAPAGTGVSAVASAIQRKPEHYTVQAVFWARRVDMAERSEGEAIFVRVRHTNRDWVTSVSSSKYTDSNWKVLFAFDPASPNCQHEEVAIRKAATDRILVDVKSDEVKSGTRVYMVPPGEDPTLASSRQWGTVESIDDADIDVKFTTGPTSFFTRVSKSWFDQKSDAVTEKDTGVERQPVWPPGAIRIWKTDRDGRGSFTMSTDEVRQQARRCLEHGGTICVRCTTRQQSVHEYVRTRPGVGWPLESLAQGRAMNLSPTGTAATHDVCAATWEGPYWIWMRSQETRDLSIADGWLYHGCGSDVNSLHLRQGETSLWKGIPRAIEVWLEPRFDEPRAPPLPLTRAFRSTSSDPPAKCSVTCTELAQRGRQPQPADGHIVFQGRVFAGKHPSLQQWEVLQLADSEPGNWVAPRAPGCPLHGVPHLDGVGAVRTTDMFWAHLRDPTGTSHVDKNRGIVRWCPKAGRPACVLTPGGTDKRRIVSSFTTAPEQFSDDSGGIDGDWAPPVLPQGMHAVRVECYASVKPGPGLAAIVVLPVEGRMMNAVVAPGADVPEFAKILGYVHAPA